MGSWHCEQVSEPTNSAPGMLGGATTVRVTVAQETAAATAVSTPVTTNNLRRLTFLFPESLSCAGDSCNESPIVSVGFRKAVEIVRNFYLFPDRRNKGQRRTPAPPRLPVSERRMNCSGLCPRPLDPSLNTVVEPTSARVHALWRSFPFWLLRLSSANSYNSYLSSKPSKNLQNLETSKPTALGTGVCRTAAHLVRASRILL